jgi:hypothetical protein
MLQHQILFQDPFKKTEKHTLQVKKVGTKYTIRVHCRSIWVICV